MRVLAVPVALALVALVACKREAAERLAAEPRETAAMPFQLRPWNSQSDPAGDDGWSKRVRYAEEMSAYAVGRSDTEYRTRGPAMTTLELWPCDSEIVASVGTSLRDKLEALGFIEVACRE